MTIFQITSDGGDTLGFFRGTTQEEAYRAMCIDAGYESIKEAYEAISDMSIVEVCEDVPGALELCDVIELHWGPATGWGCVSLSAVVAEWQVTGIPADEVEAWLAIGVDLPSAAASLRESGISPEDATEIVETIEGPVTLAVAAQHGLLRLES